MREALPEVLADCGCGAPVVTETQDRLNLCFDVPLESVPPFYWQMVGVELEFGPESHRELARLCTVRRHAAEMLALDRPCTVRLELRFRGERRQTTPGPGVARA